MKKQEDLISLAEYAKIHGVDQSSVRGKILRGNLPAKKIGRNWVIDRNQPYIDRRKKTMIKFELRKNTREMSYTERIEIKPGCSLNTDIQEPEIVKVFKDKAVALKELQKYISKIDTFDAPAGTCYSITEWYVEENEYNEDDEWISGGDVWGFSKMKIELVRKENYDVLAEFDNLADADKAYRDSKEDVYISFN